MWRRLSNTVTDRKMANVATSSQTLRYNGAGLIGAQEQVTAHRPIFTNVQALEIWIVKQLRSGKTSSRVDHQHLEQ